MLISQIQRRSHLDESVGRARELLRLCPVFASVTNNCHQVELTISRIAVSMTLENCQGILLFEVEKII